MFFHLKGGAVLAFATLLICVAQTQNPPTIRPQTNPTLRPQLPVLRPAGSMPIYLVDRAQVPQELAMRLASRLGLQGEVKMGDGSVRIIGPEFLKLPMSQGAASSDNEDKKPTQAMALNLQQLAAIKAPDRQAAMMRVQEALKSSNLEVPGGKPTVGNTTLEIAKPGTPSQTFLLDTFVSYQFMLGAVPLVGPGAKIRIAFGPGDRVTQIRYAYRTLKQGPSVPILSADAAIRQMALRLGTPSAVASKLQRRLVYYAPPSELGGVKALFPHYEFSGRFVSGKETVELRPTLVPAVQTAPQVQLDARVEQGAVAARAAVKGGRGPYSFQWITTGSPIISSTATLNYKKINTREKEDLVTVVVTDADGLISVARAKVMPTPAEVLYASLEPAPEPEPEMSLRSASIPRLDVGVEYGGMAYADIGQPALGLTAGNASGFRNQMASYSVPSQFFWGDKNAWEQDFKASSMGGDDVHYSDDVDMTFFTGHANSNGFIVPSEHGENWVTYDDARWGDSDSEWIVIAACGPLQESSTISTRWGPAFQGLHAILGYASNSADTDREGHTFGNYMHGLTIFGIRLSPPQTVVNAWLLTGIDIQGSSVKIGAMGPIRNDGVTNQGDFFWGWGPTGPDIRASQTSGYWIIRTGC